MSILDPLKKIEESIKDKIDIFFNNGNLREPFDLQRSILKEVVNHIISLEEGVRIFPYELTVLLLVNDETRRAELEAAF